MLYYVMISFFYLICKKYGVDKNYVIVEENWLNNIIPDYVLFTIIKL